MSLPTLTSAITWSKTDQALLDDLTERRKAHDQACLGAVRNVVTELFPSMRPPRQQEMINDFICRADAIRDALAPFDSGVRVLEQSV